MASEAEWAWAAGFYEGEGTLIMHGQNRGYQFQIGQKDPEPLNRFQQIAGCGAIYGPYENGTPNRIVYSYRITKARNVLWVVSNMWEWLSVRRQEQIALVYEKRSNSLLKVVV